VTIQFRATIQVLLQPTGGINARLTFCHRTRRTFTGIYADVFDTFVRDITVIKVPLQTPTPTQDGLFGFGPNQASQNFTNTPVSGVFPARIRYSYGPAQSTPLNPEINAYIFRSTSFSQGKTGC
jgi:hypothetical protein